MHNKISPEKFLILKQLIFLIVFTQIFSACTTTKKVEVKKQIPLSENLAYSETTDLTVNIPYGWSAAEDNICNCIDLWLIKDDFSSTISFTKLNFDSTLIDSTNADEITALLNFSKQEKINKLREKFFQIGLDEKFLIDSIPAGSYKYENLQQELIKIVLFKYQNSYFEVAAVPTSEVSKTPAKTDELFEVQKSIINSIKF